LDTEIFESETLLEANKWQHPNTSKPSTKTKN